MFVKFSKIDGGIQNSRLIKKRCFGKNGDSLGEQLTANVMYANHISMSGHVITDDWIKFVTLTSTV